jgi:hypothetical protein
MSKGKRISEDQYNQLVNAYLEKPGAHEYAAAMAMCDAKTAAKFWTGGDPKRSLAAIQFVVQQHVEKAKAEWEAGQRKLAAEEQVRREDAKKIAIATRSEEQQITQLARKELVPLLATVASLAAQASKLALPDASGQVPLAHALFEHEVAKARVWMIYEQALMAGQTSVPKPDVGRPSLTLEEMARYMQRVSILAQRTINAAMESAKLTRLFLGEPTDIIGIVDETREMTIEELHMRAESALKALESEEQRAKSGSEPPELRVVTGGKK